MGKAKQEKKSRGPCPLCERTIHGNAKELKDHIKICEQLKRLGLERG